MLLPPVERFLLPDDWYRPGLKPSGRQATHEDCSLAIIHGLVGAGALVTEGKEFPDNSLIIGSPAKAVRTLTAQEIEGMQRNTGNYVERAQFFKTNLKRIG